MNIGWAVQKWAVLSGKLPLNFVSKSSVGWYPYLEYGMGCVGGKVNWLITWKYILGLCVYCLPPPEGGGFQIIILFSPPDSCYPSPVQLGHDLCICSIWQLCCLWRVGQHLLYLQSQNSGGKCACEQRTTGTLRLPLLLPISWWFPYLDLIWWHVLVSFSSLGTSILWMCSGVRGGGSTNGRTVCLDWALPLKG